MGSRQDRLEADAVAAAFPKILSSLVGDPLGHRHGTYPSGLRGDGQSKGGRRGVCSGRGCVGYLGDHDVAVGRSASLDEAVQDELWHLGGFAAACRPSDDHHWVAVQRRHDLILKLLDGQLVALLYDLQPRDARQ